MTQIFHNRQPSRGGDRKTFEVMTSTKLKGTLGSVASFLAATLYQTSGAKLLPSIFVLFNMCIN